MKKIIFLFLLLILISGCMYVPPGERECVDDSDCVFESCCHPTECTLIDFAPDCSDIFCTEECASGTLDCGGSCACIDGKCAGQNYFQ